MLASHLLPPMIRFSLRFISLAALISPFSKEHMVAAELELGVDVNGDALIVFEETDQEGRFPVDTTAPDRPFLFWYNYDQDDVPFYETWPIARKDYETDNVDSSRDMEDFSRLHLRFKDWAPYMGRPDVEIEFHLTSTDAGPPPGIQMVRSADPEGGRAYLLDKEAAELQKAPPFGNRKVLLKDGEPWSVTTEAFDGSDLGSKGTLICLLFEGAKPGKGQLVVRLKEKGAVVAESDPLYLEIRHVKTFFRRVTTKWPEDIQAPYKYRVEPPVPDLKWEFEPMGYPYQPAWYDDGHTIVWIHGWVDHTKDNYNKNMTHSTETIFKRLFHQGFRGEFCFYHWPSIKTYVTLGMNGSEYRAYKVAQPLMDYYETIPDDRIVHFTAHSLGNVVLIECLKLGLEVEEAIFQSAAIPVEMLDDRDVLKIPNMENAKTPEEAEEMGYEGYLRSSKTRIYALYNPNDFTFWAYNLLQKDVKPFGTLMKQYKYKPNKPEGERIRLRYWFFFSRPVTDPHEAMAYAARARTHALGAESRTRGLVHEVYNLDAPPFEYGTGHVVAWSWNPQRTMAYYNLLLDLMNIPHNSLAF